MEKYTYNFEIRRMILHFMSAIDGGVIKRYDKDRKVKDTIKVNYVYGPKERIFKDLVNQSEHIKLPIVSIMLTGIARDQERVKDNIVGRYEDMVLFNRGSNYNIPMPVPVNLTFDVVILSKYQMDLEQLLTNFIPYSDPSFYVSWQEPFTGYEIRSEVRWNGDISIENPNDLSPTDPYQHITATTSFEFKGYIFKDRAEDVGKICRVDTDYILTNKFYCDYDDLLENTVDAVTESFSISGVPRVEWCSPLAIKTGMAMSACSGVDSLPSYDPNELVGATESLTIEGWFPNVNEVFLSASDPSMFKTQSVSSFDIFDGDEKYPKFDGVIVQSFVTPNSDFNKITFNLPELEGDGYLDVIVVNSCGYSKLTNDHRTTNSCCDNPYPISHFLYDSWEKLQDPFVNGIEVIQTNYTCVSSGETIMQTIGGKAIKTLGEFFMIEL